MTGEIAGTGGRRTDGVDVGQDLVGGDNADGARDVQGYVDIYRLDVGVGVLAPDEDREAHARQLDIVQEGAPALDHAGQLGPTDTVVFIHRALRCRIVFNAACGRAAIPER